jgi:rhamnose utilization protein RhaD (predicted bifunctional aldolase and dehydrogenase)
VNGFLLKEQEAKAFKRESAGPGSTTRKFFFSKTAPGCDTLLHAFRNGKFVLETHRHSGAGRNPELYI